MNMLWHALIRPLFFCFPAEFAHHLAMSGFALAMRAPFVPGYFRSRYGVHDPKLACDVLGLKFSNPVGLAAGFDKNGQWFEILERLGFGHIEIGTLTAHPQPGNPKPRLFRLQADRALLNRMGFNNDGSETAARQLASRSSAVPLGINLGKSKITELAAAAEDYGLSFERLFAFASYFTINVSSPNTPGLRKLQNRDDLEKIISVLQSHNEQQAAANSGQRKPILLKIAPDLSHDQLGEIAELAVRLQLDGIIATNTTISRDNLKTAKSKLEALGNGGISGRPLTERSREIVRFLYSQLRGRVPLIGCGGIMSGEDAWEMITHGAALVQIYTGFVYGGPSFVRDVNRHLLERLDQTGLASIQDAVGIAVDQASGN